MKQTWILVLVAAVIVMGFSAASSAGTVTIEYWQYFFQSKVELVDQLIAEFEAENPGIKVVHTTFPYAQFNEKIATSVPAGTGPDVVNLYYGWLPLYVGEGYLQPLPREYFPRERIESEFLPMVIQGSKLDGEYWALPTGVRTLALAYNKTLFEQAGIGGPPQTWDEFVEAAKKLTVTRRGQFHQVGFGAAPTGQDHHLIREVLFRQWGVQPYSDDNRRVLWGDDPRAAEAFTFYTDLITKHQVTEIGFLDNYRQAFIAGRSGMIVEGSFALGTFTRDIKQFEWGIAELPGREAGGVRSTFGSFWSHGLTRNATGEKLEAAAKFLQFLTSERTMRRWLEYVGELPARTSLARAPELLADPVYGPFIAGLNYAHATFFADEQEERAALVDAVDEVVLRGTDPGAALQRAAERAQATLDRYFQSR